MKLGRFCEFVRHVREDEALGAHTSRADIYRRFDGIWYDEHDTQSKDERLLSALEQTLAKNQAWRRTMEYRAYFPLSSIDSVVVAYFSNKPTRVTRDKILSILLDTAQRAKNAYDATHDALTELLNKAAFEDFLSKKLRGGTLAGSSSGEEVEGATPPTSLVLLTIDIDYFKQVNDSFGHFYGDLVLKSFAMRMESACSSIKHDMSDSIDFVCARPSGSEFGVVVIGQLSPDLEMVIAEQLRSAIADKPLPSEEEWKVVTRGVSVDLVQFPHASDRRVTASIGLASVHAGSFAGGTDQIVEQLKTQADLALYRAKAAGRDRCVKYTDILTRFGKVLQHHPETDVVAIDLGRQMKVSLGQEFYVFHPQFSGTEPFIFRDGRTERKLGVYPKVPCGRIEVFDVQAEISFSRVHEKRAINSFPAGCLLEAIPVGSIAHLIRDEWWAGGIGDLVKAGRELITRELQRAAASDDNVMMFVIVLGNEEELIGSRGIGFVNRALAALYTRLRHALTDVDGVAQVASDRFGVVSTRFREDLQGNILDLVGEVSESLEGIATFAIGVYVHSEVKRSEWTGDMSEYKITNALDYAFLAIEAGKAGKDGLLRFSRATPQNVLFKARREGAYDQVEKDYETLQKLGIKSANVENQRALALFALGSIQEALAAAEEAVRLNPDDEIHKANVALLAFGSGDRAKAGRLFLQLGHPEQLKSKLYLVARAMGLYELFKTRAQEVDRTELIRLLEQAKEGRPDSRLKVSWWEIEYALVNVKRNAA